MKFIEDDKIVGKGIHGTSYNTDRPLTVDDIISIIKGYENENTKLFECRCSTFSEAGNPMDCNYRDVEELEALHSLPNPSINVRAIFVDPRDMSYKFTIGMAANTKGMNYFISDKAEEYIRYTLELDAMEREAAEKNSQENQITNGGNQK